MMARRADAVRCLLFAMLVVSPGLASAETKRLVLIKADGLAQDIVEQLVSERNPRTGQSVLPWIEHLFYKNGTRVSNFYVRGTSLSGPSWSMLDTGQHLQIKGNVEFDRYTQHLVRLSELSFRSGSARSRGAATTCGARPSSTSCGCRCCSTRIRYDERYQSFQLFQRGKRIDTLSQGVQKRFTTRSARDLVDEW